jgi:imidazolonepropionase
MNADLLITGISQLATPIGAGARYGAQMREITILEKAAIAIADGRFVWTGAAREWTGTAARKLDLGGRGVIPGLVDPHTHAIWAGDRLRDFDARTSGVTYEQILAAGGGIWSTIRATTDAADDTLVSLTEQRLWSLIRSGATTIEVKSGYGFSVESELRLLRLIHEAASKVPARIVPTLLIHLPPKDPDKHGPYIDQVRRELIPEVARLQLATVVDVFIEKEAWSAKQAEAMLTCALEKGLSIKVHAEQFHSVGGAELAIRLIALSVDHLEACKPPQYSLFREKPTIATVLPGVSLHLGLPKAPARQLIDAGAAVAVGTDLNPGSSPLFSTSAALGLAVRLNGLSTSEALVAGTVNASHALGLADVGRIEAGARADFLVLDSPDWRDLLYTLGKNPVREVWCNGIRIVPDERSHAHE